MNKKEMLEKIARIKESIIRLEEKCRFLAQTRDQATTQQRECQEKIHINGALRKDHRRRISRIEKDYRAVLVKELEAGK